MRQFTESEQELTVFFTSALGVGAQGYEPSSSGEFDSGAALETRMFNKRHVEQVKAHRVVEWTLERVGAADARTLNLAFYPRRIGAGPFQAGLGRLAALALDSDAARQQFAEWVAARPARTGLALVDWLDAEATRQSPPRCRGDIALEAEARLQRALARYDVVRRDRVHLERQVRREAEERTAEKCAVALGERFRAPKARPAVVSMASAIAALLADHADLLDPDPTPAE